MSHEAELPIPGAMLDDSQNTSRTPTPRHSCPPSTSRHSHNSSTCDHLETLQTVQGDDLFEDEEGMVPDPNVYQTEVRMVETIPTGSQPSDSESAVTADEGHQSSTSDVGQSSSQRTGTLRRAQDASEFSGGGGGSQTNYGAHHQDKCRYEEVDYSQALRRELYVKKEAANNMRMRMRSLKVTCQSLEEQNRRLQAIAQCELESQQGKIIELQKIIQQQEEEQEVLCAQLVMDQQAASLQHRNDIESLRQEMKANMESQLQDLLKESCETLNKALEQRDLELNERVNAVQATLMGTANRQSLQPDRMDTMETSTTTNGSSMPMPTRSPKQHTCPSAQAAGPSAWAAGPSARASGPSVPVSAVTPNLDTIRKLRKKRGFSCKTHLIGVPLEEQNEGNSPRAPSIEREPSVPPHDQLPNPQTSAFTDALTRGVETALRNIFASGQFSQYTKQSPHKRRIQAKEVDEIRVIETQEERNFHLQQEKVRLLFQEKFNFAHDMDFIVYEPVDKDEVHAYEYEDGPGPNPERLQFDLAKNSKSPWNSAVLGILCQQLKDQCTTEQWPMQWPDTYIRQLLTERYKRLRTTWRNAQPKLTEKGTVETPAETEARLVAVMSRVR
ncbi:hypothetical protein EDD17DRAFT_1509127 [Pisolithus thermaeus]|nr:hypothetical protein EDD17DRAFT_1509127 [Pisolithus thermaeus]